MNSIVGTIANSLSQPVSDIVKSPSEEFSLFLADKIKFLRWRSGIKTLERARTMLEEVGGEKNAPPIKFFLPWLENCSLEEEQNTALHDMWASLLVSSTKSDFLAFQTECMNILRAIDPVIAKVIKSVYHDFDPTLLGPKIESGFWSKIYHNLDGSGILEENAFAQGNVPRDDKWFAEAKKNYNLFFSKEFLEYVAKRGYFIDSMRVYDFSENDNTLLFLAHNPLTNKYPRFNYLVEKYNILSLEGLDNREIDEFKNESLTVCMQAYSYTGFGYDFYRNISIDHVGKPELASFILSED